MGKYLHHYTSLDEFQKDYNDDGGINSFVCSAGTFMYDRYEENDGIYFWKNGDKELITSYRSPKVGAYNYEDGTGAYDIDNNTGVEITEVGEVQPGKYQEPWVSYTDDKTTRVRKFKATVSGLINGVTYDNEEHTFTIIGETGFTI